MRRLSVFFVSFLSHGMVSCEFFFSLCVCVLCALWYVWDKLEYVVQF